MGRKGRIARRNLDMVRTMLGAALDDSTIEAVKGDVQAALEALELLPGGAQAAPKRVRRMSAYWFGKGPTRWARRADRSWRL